MSDATGNVLLTDNRYGTEGSKVEFDALCRFEPAWKLQVYLIRKRPEEAPPDRVWRIHIPAFPARNRYVEVKASLQDPDYSLEVERISGGGTIKYSGGSAFTDAPVIFLHGSANGAVPQLSVRRMVTAHGREFHVRDPASELLRDGVTGNFFNLPAIPPGTPVDVTLAIHRTRTVELMVKP